MSLSPILNMMFPEVLIINTSSIEILLTNIVYTQRLLVHRGNGCKHKMEGSCSYSSPLSRSSERISTLPAISSRNIFSQPSRHNAILSA